MRRFLLIFLLLQLHLLLISQNLVPNHSFEDVNYYPTAMLDSGHEFDRDCKYWSTPNLASTDLITSRFKTPKFSPITPFDGKHMAGIVTHGDFWSEYLKVRLKEPLEKGDEYYVEFWIAYCREYHKDDKKRFTNPYLGAYFADDFFTKEEKILQLKNQVGIQEKIELKDKIWTKISGSFLAEEESEYLYLGQFQNPDDPENFLIGYFFIDDILVKKFKDNSTVFSPKEFAPDGLNNIYFETDKYDLLPQSFVTLDKVVLYLQKNQSIKVEINGHTDSEGENYHNAELSQNRAKSVFNYLVNKGIDPTRLTSKGMGSSMPISTNDTEIGRQENRRVEFLASSNRIVKKSLSEVNVTEADDSYDFSDNLGAENQNYKYNFIGKYRDIFNCQLERKTATGHNYLGDYKASSAKNYLKEKTKDKQFVFINDSPIHPQTRIFTRSLLQDFYNNGFRYLAVEAFTNNREINSNFKYPTINAGQLTDEPLFGEMIRKALDIGFKLISFMPSKEELAKAEKIVKTRSESDTHLKTNTENWAKAMNLNRIILKDKSAKYLVCTNKDQLLKYSESGHMTLVNWFERITKNDVYTIEQAIMNEQCPQTEHKAYKFAKVGSPSVYLKYKTPYISAKKDQDNLFDIQIFHPRTQFIQNRPDWFRMAGYRIPYELNADQYKMSYPLIAMAYLKSEDAEIAVPIDVIEFENNRIGMPFLLPAGEYNLILKDKSKRKKFEIEVKE